MARKDLLSRLADAGEEALSKLGDSPGSERLLGFAHNMRERMDEMQKKVRGIDELEKRVAALEKQLAASGKSSTGKRAASKPAASKASASKSSASKSSASKARSGAAKTKTASAGPAASSTRRTGGGSPG
jgi:hypothetical protein